MWMCRPGEKKLYVSRETATSKAAKWLNSAVILDTNSVTDENEYGQNSLLLEKMAWDSLVSYVVSVKINQKPLRLTRKIDKEKNCVTCETFHRRFTVHIRLSTIDNRFHRQFTRQVVLFSRKWQDDRLMITKDEQNSATNKAKYCRWEEKRLAHNNIIYSSNHCD